VVAEREVERLVGRLDLRRALQSALLGLVVLGAGYGVGRWDGERQGAAAMEGASFVDARSNIPPQRGMAVQQEWNMKNILALALVAASLTAFPIATPAFAGDTSLSPLCGPEAPEAYKRPGGFCDQIGSNSSLLEPQEEECYYNLVGLTMKLADEPLLVAINCGYDVAPLVSEVVS
jgi:hypothetical protein